MKKTFCTLELARLSFLCKRPVKYTVYDRAKKVEYTKVAVRMQMPALLPLLLKCSCNPLQHPAAALLHSGRRRVGRGGAVLSHSGKPCVCLHGTVQDAPP